jgi:hypothetical protein
LTQQFGKFEIKIKIKKRVVSAAVKIEVEVETGSEAATKGWEYSLLNPVNVDRAEKKH